MKQVAFLRGVNVGGKNRVPMKELARFLCDAGFTGVSTYIQSGNVLFNARADAAPQMETLIAQKFGVETRVIVRDGAQLCAVVHACPYPAELAYVTLLQREVPPFAPVNTERDTYVHARDNIYICMNGPAHESKLQNAVFEKRTGVPATTRNLKTLAALCSLLQHA